MQKILDIMNFISKKAIKMGDRAVEKSTCLGVYEPPIPEKLKQLRAKKDEKIR